MKKNLLLSLGLFLQISSNAQCGAPISGGSASGFLTSFTRGSLNPVVADKTLNTVAFIHRTNTVTTGGSFGNLVYDISTNNGASWTPNSGPLNPVMTSFARFPNLTIYNPASNTTPANAYIGYMAATFNTVSSTYNGVVSGVRQISGTGNTENYNQPVVNPSLIPGSIVKGAPGVFWAIDGLYNGTYVTGFTIYKGVWNNTTNDIVWSNNFNVSPSFNTGYTATGAVPADYNIAFDPTGTIGYLSFMGHLASGPAGFAYYPVVYKTTNGGNTWSGPLVVDITQFSCLTTNVGVGNIPSAGFEHDLVVDVNGNPHLITLLINGNNAYAVYFGLWHHVYDITLKNGLWAAYDLGNLNAGRATWGTAPNTVTQDIFPRIARSADGTKIFYTWTDNSTYTAGQANLTPNLFSKAYNVTTDKWTPTKDFSSCNVATAGKMLFPHLAPEVLEPSSGMYQLATVYGEFSTVANDPTLDVNFKFLDNATYAAAEFSVATPPAVVNIQPGPGILLCPSSAVTLSLAIPQGQYLWSTGSSNSVISISQGTATSYSVIAQQGCYVGTASVTVSNLTVSAGAVNPNICPGTSTTFTVTGNALGYTWTPSSFTGTNVVFIPNTNTITLTAMGSGCTDTKTVLVNIMPLPTLSIAGSNTICSGQILTQTITGADTYLWNNGSTASTFTDMPMSFTIYSVTGTALNTCTSALTVSVTVKASPTLNVVSSSTAVCMGQTLGITVLGASTYSMNGVASTNSATFAPGTNTVYTITGAAVNLCQTSKTLGIVVNALPVMTITPTKTQFCKGEKTKLTVTGATSYTWVSPGVLGSTVQVNPTVTTTYSVSGASLENCVNTQTFTLVVSLCAGINENSKNASQVIIYPNPNNGTFTIKAESDLSLNIFNELGQLVRSISVTQSNNYEINIQELPSGIYFIMDRDGGQSVSQKIVVTR